jgi:hypothetical protein
MVAISDVSLFIAERDGKAFAEVSYRVLPTGQDFALKRSFREIVELIGVDEGVGEDGHSEVIRNGRIYDELLAFGTSDSTPGRTRAVNLASADLDEDPGPVPRRDEIRARVTLIPIVTAESNVVTRGAPANTFGSTPA